MQTSDWINVVLCILSFALATISVVTVVITLRQNHEMIENATRPYIVIKYESIVTTKGVARYIVVKNYGQTAARITSMKYSGETNDPFDQQFKKIVNASLAPSQRLLYYFGGANTGDPETLSFEFMYTANGKAYNDVTNLTLITGASTTRQHDEHAIAYVLQDIAERLI